MLLKRQPFRHFIRLPWVPRRLALDSASSNLSWSLLAVTSIRCHGRILSISSLSGWSSSSPLFFGLSRTSKRQDKPAILLGLPEYLHGQHARCHTRSQCCHFSDLLGNNVSQLHSTCGIGFWQSQSSESSLIYLGATRVATAFLAGGFLWVYANSGSWSFEHWHLHSQGMLIPALLIALGLCTKAGIWPFHLWLPYAHTIAPSPVSALISGVMIKIAVYTMLRLFIVDGAGSLPIAILFASLGIVSAVWGVLFALVQQRSQAIACLQQRGKHGLNLGRDWHRRLRSVTQTRWTGYTWIACRTFSLSQSCAFQIDAISGGWHSGLRVPLQRSQPTGWVIPETALDYVLLSDWLHSNLCLATIKRFRQQVASLSGNLPNSLPDKFESHGWRGDCVYRHAGSGRRFISALLY